MFPGYYPWLGISPLVKDDVHIMRMTSVFFSCSARKNSLLPSCRVWPLLVIRWWLLNLPTTETRVWSGLVKNIPGLGNRNFWTINSMTGRLGFMMPRFATTFEPIADSQGSEKKIDKLNRSSMIIHGHPLLLMEEIRLTSWYGKCPNIYIHGFYTFQVVSRISSINSIIILE